MRIIRPPCRAFLLGVAAVVAGGQLRAQSAPPATALPLELVNALFTGGAPAGSATRYFVGAPPPGWPTALLPAPPIAVIGSMESGRSLVAVFADSASHQPLDVLNRQIESAGWTRPSRAPQQGFGAEHGFMSSDARYAYWCGDSTTVIVSALRSPPAMAYVRVSVGPPRRAACAPAPQPREPFSTLTLPPLLPPKGVRSDHNGGGSGGNSMNASTRLIDSTMTPSALLAHYAEQLKKAGWTTSPPTEADDFASQAVAARDKKGVPWHGMLIVIPSAGARDVSIVMTRPSIP